MIVEARKRSGALITADFALEDGREVFAVPGEITGALAAGTNRLLRQGATPLTSTEDVLEVFGLERRPQAPPKIGHAAARVLERLADAPLTADELGLGLALQPGELAAALAELELVGAAQESDGVYRAVMRRASSITTDGGALIARRGGRPPRSPGPRFFPVRR